MGNINYYAINRFGNNFIANRCYNINTNTKYIIQIESEHNGFGVQPIIYSILTNGKIQEVELNGWRFFPVVSGYAKASMYYENYTTITLKCIDKTGNNSEFRISESSSSYEEIALKIINTIENLSIYNSIEEYNNLQYSINQNANIFESTDVLKKICASLSIINNNENNDPSIYALKNKIISDFNSLKSIIQKIELE